MKSKFMIAGLALAAPAWLADAAPAEPPAQFEAMLRCRAVTDDAARLACFDEAAAALDAAIASRDVVVVDRKQIRESKRTLFGLPIPDLPLFGGGGDGPEEEEITSITGTVRSASRDGDGRWLVRLEEGSVWRQIDSRPLALRPKAGMEVEIDRGALGSYRMSVAGQPGIKVRRES